MQPEARERLRHVRDSAEAIVRYTTGKTFDDYEDDEILRDAVQWRFMIVGEALREALKLEPSMKARVTSYQRVVDFRNVLVHDYAIIYDKGVWLVIEQHLPLLLTEVRALLAESDAAP
jgi:uncharacterized protein with HEPN domain